MISAPTSDKNHLIFKAFVHMIATISGVGFHNGDQGYPAYLFGANDGKVDPVMGGDSPEKNGIFKLLASFD